MTLAPALALPESKITDEGLADLRHPDAETRERAFDDLLRSAGATQRAQPLSVLLLRLEALEDAYRERLQLLMRQQAPQRREAHRSDIGRLRDRLRASLEPGRTDSRWALYRALLGLWYPAPAALESDAEFSRIKAEMAWHDARARDMGAPLPAQRQRLDELKRGARLAIVARSTHGAGKAVSAIPPKATDSLSPGELEALMLTNEYRTIMGLDALEASAELSECARRHSEDMRTHRFFSHQSPVADRRTLADRARLCGQRVRSENIARHCSTGAMAFRTWFDSRPHHRNLLDSDHRRSGVGQAGQYFTQWFGTN